MCQKISFARDEILKIKNMEKYEHNRIKLLGNGKKQHMIVMIS